MPYSGWPNFHKNFYKLFGVFSSLTGFYNLLAFTYSFKSPSLTIVSFPTPHFTSHLPRVVHPSLPQPSTFVHLFKGFCYCQNSQRQQCFNWQETVFTLSGFPIMWCAAFSRNTIASKNRNCLDLSSSQHNDSMTNGTGLESGPNALKCRDYQWRWRKPLVETSKWGQAYLLPILLFCLILPVKLG